MPCDQVREFQMAGQSKVNLDPGTMVEAMEGLGAVRLSRPGSYSLSGLRVDVDGKTITVSGDERRKGEAESIVRKVRLAYGVAAARRAMRLNRWSIPDAQITEAYRAIASGGRATITARRR